MVILQIWDQVIPIKVYTGTSRVGLICVEPPSWQSKVRRRSELTSVPLVMFYLRASVFLVLCVYFLSAGLFVYCELT